MSKIKSKLQRSDSKHVPGERAGVRGNRTLLLLSIHATTRALGPEVHKPWKFTMHRQKVREVLECGGWRGTGLTPLSSCASWVSFATLNAKAVCLTPRPPHSKVTADQLRSTQIKHLRPSAF